MTEQEQKALVMFTTIVSLSYLWHLALDTSRGEATAHLIISIIIADIVFRIMFKTKNN